MAAGGERRLRVAWGACVATACGSAAAVAWLWPPASEWPWREASEVRVKAALAVGVLALLGLAELLTRSTRSTRPTRQAGRPGRVGGRGLLLLAAGLSLAAHFNFGHFHYPGFLHPWEQFHYQLGSKYFPELGYDGLYLASLAAQREQAPARPLQARIRDLRNNALVAPARLAGHEARVRARFTPERWRDFREDHAHFLRAVPRVYLDAFRRDHGYNPTPAWTAVARLLNGGLTLDAPRLHALAAVDLLLLALAFGAVGAAFGLRVACFALVVFGLGYAGRFRWIGGAFLRLDWFAALLGGVCLLQRRRPAWAGALFGYAAAVRLFPAVFALGPGLVALAQAWRGERPRWALRFGAGLAAALAVALLAGAAAGRGFQAWGELARRMEVYQFSRGRNVVGLENVVLFGGEVLRRAHPASAAAEPRWDLTRQAVERRKRERAPLLRAAQGALLALFAVAAWRATPAAAAVLSLAALFALAVPANYYWVALALAPLARGRRDVFALLALNLAFHGAHLLTPDLLVRYGLVSWGLLGLFLSWLLPDAVAALRARGAPAGRVDSRVP